MFRRPPLGSRTAQTIAHHFQCLSSNDVTHYRKVRTQVISPYVAVLE